jgi:hypothetical protein
LNLGNLWIWLSQKGNLIFFYPVPRLHHALRKPKSIHAEAPCWKVTCNALASSSSELNVPATHVSEDVLGDFSPGFQYPRWGS